MPQQQEDQTGIEIRSYRELCASQMGRNEYKNLYCGVLSLGVNEDTDVIQRASIIWDKETDRFGIAFPKDSEDRDDANIAHVTRVHFYHEGYKPVENTGAFVAISEILEDLPQLKGKDLTLSERAGGDRIIDGMTHAQLEAVINAAVMQNTAAMKLAEMRQAYDDMLQLTADNAFANKPAEPEPEKKSAKKQATRSP